MNRILIPAVLLALWFGAAFLPSRWIHAPAGFVADLRREELQKRVQSFRRRSKLWECGFRVIVLLALFAPPVAGQLAVRGGLLSRETLMDVVAVGGTVFYLAVLFWMVAPVALARRLRLFCPSCRRLMVAARHEKEARRGECFRCGHVVARQNAG